MRCLNGDEQGVTSVSLVSDRENMFLGVVRLGVVLHRELFAVNMRVAVELLTRPTCNVQRAVDVHPMLLEQAVTMPFFASFFSV
jgi:hypothetical protein